MAVVREAFVDVMTANFAIAGVALRAGTANSRPSAAWRAGYEWITAAIDWPQNTGRERRFQTRRIPMT